MLLHKNNPSLRDEGEGFVNRLYSFHDFNTGYDNECFGKPQCSEETWKEFVINSNRYKRNNSPENLKAMNKSFANIVKQDLENNGDKQALFEFTSRYLSQQQGKPMDSFYEKREAFGFSIINAKPLTQWYKENIDMNGDEKKAVEWLDSNVNKMVDKIEKEQRDSVRLKEKDIHNIELHNIRQTHDGIQLPHGNVPMP